MCDNVNTTQNAQWVRMTTASSHSKLIIMVFQLNKCLE